MSRATNDLLDELHGLVAGSLKDELSRARKFAEHDDPEKREPISPQLIDKVLKFLKDNQITAPASNEGTNALADELAGLDVDLDEESARLIN